MENINAVVLFQQLHMHEDSAAVLSVRNMKVSRRLFGDAYGIT